MLMEREEVAGPDYYPTDPVFKKWAHEKGSLYLGDQKIKVTRPRLRHVEQGEVTLASYARLRTPGAFSEELREKILSVACRPRRMPRPFSRRARPWGCRPRRLPQAERHLAKPYRTEAHRRRMTALAQASYADARRRLRELEAWLRAKNESAADSLLEALEELYDGTSADGTGLAARDAAVDQPDRDQVLAGSAQCAEYQTRTRECDAPTLAGDGVARLRAAGQSRERLCRDCAGPATIEVEQAESQSAPTQKTP